jgi:hypothetical protein
MEKMTDGEDIIFFTGAPGSKWSRITTVLSLWPELNNTDQDKYPTYRKNAFPDESPRSDIPVGNHSGVYFGPDHGIGEDFHDLSKLTKEEFLNEIERAYDNFDTGIKIVKSHWFCHNNNLNWLKENFPESHIVLVYNGDAEAFKWWHFIGGWDITFPYYTWYENNEGMWKWIKKENENLIDFCKQNGLDLTFRNNFIELTEELGLSHDLSFVHNLTDEQKEWITRGKPLEEIPDLAEHLRSDEFGSSIGTTMAIWSKEKQDSISEENFKKILKESKKRVRLDHLKLGVDHHLKTILGHEEYDKLFFNKHD